MNITLQGLDQFTERLNEIDKKQIPFALARALTKLGQMGRDVVQQDINANVDNPTPFTKRATFVAGPSGKAYVVKGETSVVFGLKPIQSGYLDVQYFGGSSALRPFETKFIGKHLVATDNAERDQYGNAPKAYIQRVLSDAKAKRNGYYMTKKTVRYRPKGGESLTVFNILDKAPTYTPTLSLDESIEVVLKAWPSVFDRAFKEAMATAR